MNYIGTAFSESGVVRPDNQDSVCLKIARDSAGHQLVLAVVCDGVGGLKQGEVASGVLVLQFVRWFEQMLQKQVVFWNLQEIRQQWMCLVEQTHDWLLTEQQRDGARRGSTISAIFVCETEYLILHVGDCRIYQIRHELMQLTEDQTFIAMALKQGILSLDEARQDPRQHMILQCVGVGREVHPEWKEGSLLPGDGILLCTDGFYHGISEAAIFSSIQAAAKQSLKGLEQWSRQMSEALKQNREPDNYSAVVLMEVSKNAEKRRR